MQWLFGQAAVTLAVGVMLVFYFLAVEGRAWSSLSEVAIGFAILAAAPAFAAVLFNRWRRGRG